MSEFNSYDSELNPQHPMKGNDAFLVVEYGAYVKSSGSRWHRSPFIENQSWKSYISSEKIYKIVTSGATGKGSDGIVKMFVSIDGIKAISTGEVKSGWDKWIHIISSFGIKCDDANHEIEIRLEQFVQDQILQQWSKIFEKSHQLKFDKPLVKKDEDTAEKKEGSISKVKKAIFGKEK